jgi:LmbE family N-acetylglucosaminyl deacetylase
MVVAPHPDDESLHAGGLIARLRRRGAAVVVVVVSDGAASHPNSRIWSRQGLAACRAQEAAAALDVLGVPTVARDYWEVPDGAVPGPGNDGFGSLATRARSMLRRIRPRTLILPWRRDPHPDHRAACAIFLAALSGSGRRPLLLEYPGWTGILPGRQSMPRRAEIVSGSLDIGMLRGVKRRAVSAHRSQLGKIVRDDPTGFVLTEVLRRRFERPREIFWKATR